MTIILQNNISEAEWDSYVHAHPRASVYHRFAFKKVIENCYGHHAYYLTATENDRVVGVLPLFHIKSRFLGHALVSLPFCDYGGVLADNPAVESALLKKTAALSQLLRCDYTEIRQTSALASLPEQIPSDIGISTEKVRMALRLCATEDEQFSSFPAKLRSQIKKPQKEGCTATSGGIELIDDFYTVFTHNMRDLGSPVHSKKMMLEMLKNYGDKSKLFVVYHAGKPVACSLVAGFGDTLVNPWASFKRSAQKIAPNMLLYWEMLKYAVASEYRFFDFGRSTRDEGTFKFKQQWGAQPDQLYWYRIGAKDGYASGDINSGSKGRFISVWQKVPLWLTKVIGPLLRKHLHM